MLLAQRLPLLPFIRERVRFVGWQRDKRRGKPKQDIISDFFPPKGREAEFPGCVAPACQAHTTAHADETHFAQLVIADSRAQPRAEFVSQFVQTKPRARASRRVSHPAEA